MNLKYQNKGNVIYQVEDYEFRYSGKKIAKIELMIFLEEPSYAFTYKLVNEDLPSKIRERCDCLKGMKHFLLNNLEHFFPVTDVHFTWRGVHDSLSPLGRIVVWLHFIRESCS